MSAETRFRKPTVIGLTVAPLEDEDLKSYVSVRFIPMNAHRTEQGQLPGVVALLDVYICNEKWVAGVFSQVYIETSNPCNVADEDAWVADIVEDARERVVHYLWTYSSLALRTTLAAMPVAKIEIPDVIVVGDNYEIAPVEKASAR